MPSRPLKAWGTLSPSYKKRLERHGITARNYNTPKGAEIRAKARGHGKTPERPERAAKNPDKYPEYLESRKTLLQHVSERKRRLFSTTVKYRERASDRNVLRNPNPSTGGRINLAYVRRFLRMTESEIDDIDWSDDEWGFLYYH